MEKYLWKRTEDEEITLRCKMVEGTFLEEAAQSVIDLLGEERAGRQVPISGATNIVRRMLGVTARLYDQCAVTGMPVSMSTAIGDASSRVLKSRYRKIGAVPMPTSLVVGTEWGGLSTMLEYLQAVGYCGLAIDWSKRVSRPFVVVARPCDLDLTYISDDPFEPVVTRWSRERKLDGYDYLQAVDDVWDLTDLDRPVFRVERGKVDVTAEVPALRPFLGQLSGAGYWWRDGAGQPFCPVVIYGNPGSVMRGIALTEACLDAVAYRTSAKSTMIDAGFPTREVEGLTTGKEHDLSTGQAGNNQGPGDVRVWRRTDENEPGRYWQFQAAADPEVMLRTCQAQEADAVGQLGFPIELTKTGGEPLAWEVEAQQRAIRQWFPVCRDGDAGKMLPRLAAIMNRQLSASFPESGYGVDYLFEVDEALAEFAREESKEESQEQQQETNDEQETDRE